MAEVQKEGPKPVPSRRTDGWDGTHSQLGAKPSGPAIADGGPRAENGNAGLVLPVEEPTQVRAVESPRGDALSSQVGGNHYLDMKIHPTAYNLANGLGFCEGNVVKYVSRYKRKGGIEDLKKARHYLDILIDSIK